MPAYQYKDKEKRRAYVRDWARDNRKQWPDKSRVAVRKCYQAHAQQRRDAARKFYHENKDSNRDRAKDLRVARTYGIPLSLLPMLGTVCGICGAEKADSRGHWLHIDHDHTTGVVRGRLCRDCNVGLGRFKDNLGLLQAAVRYLGGNV